MRGDIDHALADFDAAVKLNPNDAIAINNRGLAHRNKGEAEAAVADFSAAIKLKPNYVNALDSRSTAYFDALDRAIADVNGTIQLDDKFAAAYNGRGVAYDGKGEFDLAIQDYSHDQAGSDQRPRACDTSGRAAAARHAPIAAPARTSGGAARALFHPLVATLNPRRAT